MPGISALSVVGCMVLCTSSGRAALVKQEIIVTDPHNPDDDDSAEHSGEQHSLDAATASDTGVFPARDDTIEATEQATDISADDASSATDARSWDMSSDPTRTGAAASSTRSLMMIGISGILLIVIIGTSLAFLFMRPAGQQRQIGGGDNTEVIAKVGDLTITRGEFLRNYTPGQDAQETLDELIMFKLVVQEGQQSGKTVDHARIDQQIEDLRTQHGDPDNFTAFLQRANIGSETELRSLLAELQLFNTMVLDNTVVEQAHSRHILLQASSETDIAQRKTEAEEIIAQLEDGADFAMLAQERSEDPGSRQNGGDLGWVPRGIFVPEFDQAIFSMEPGEIRLVQSQFGWHIIQLQEPRQKRGFDNPQFFMQSPAAQAVFDTWVDDLRTKAEQANQIHVLVNVTDLIPPPPTLPTLPTTQP